jgi:hypothetical protein
VTNIGLEGDAKLRFVDLLNDVVLQRVTDGAVDGRALCKQPQRIEIHPLSSQPTLM